MQPSFPDSMPHKRVYRSDLFSPSKLTSSGLLESSLEEIRSGLTKDNFKSVFQELINNESPHILLLVLSSLGETTPLRSWLLQSFPSAPVNYDDTIHCKIMSRLSIFFNSYSVGDEDLCARYHEVTQVTSNVLKYLASFPQAIDIGSDHRSNKGKVSQKKRKQARRAENAAAFVQKDFDVLDVDMPESSSDASILVDNILQTQKDALEFYLEELCCPERRSPAPLSVTTVPEESTMVELPSAYPIVQPMKSAEGFGEWTIVISTNADDFLRSTHRKDASTFQIIVKKIKELSRGHFSDDNQKRLSGSGTEVPVFEAKMTRDLRLIYQIDVIPCDESREQQGMFKVTPLRSPLTDIEAVKIFGIHTHAQIDSRLWSSISSQLRKRGREYRKRFSFFPADRIDARLENVRIEPRKTLSFQRSSLHCLKYWPQRLKTYQIYDLMRQPRFIQDSSILADVDATFPHMVSTQEKRIIEHPQSCYVIGRSGTGKTTTMLFKMLLVERTFQLMESDLPRPRQVFVTKSRMLAKKVQEYFSKLSSSLAMASQTFAELMRLPKSDQYQEDEVGLVDVDDIVDWRSDLPAKFSELEEKHFPLFITFDGLCDMLEADMSAKMMTPTSPIDRKRTKSHTGVITFESFFEYYWSHFPEHLVKGLDPALVFSEIIGVIKGSEETLSEGNRQLSRTTYLDLSKRQQSTFAERRGEVYEIFESTHNILKYFTEQGIPGQGIDHLYVDEVQDNMLIDTMVLRALCNNPDGLFWAGDTAQTISVGSSFRFNGLKAFQWNIERLIRRAGPIPEEAADPELDANNRQEMFQLAVNYRSHAGIVDCAHSVIDLITTFWEDSIDHLSPEVGIVDGFKPVFFNTQDRTQLEQFIFGNVGDHIEFGAQQCWSLVIGLEVSLSGMKQRERDFSNKLAKTIYESKGLEFNDVLLYDFFADSVTGPTPWRVVLNAIDESNQDPKNPPPRFDSVRHASICNELKSLYVAITRARENFWIADGSETGEPMRTFWTSKDLIQNYTPGSDAPRLASSSTPEEWASKGRELFYRKQFSHAKHCYIRARLPILASIAGSAANASNKLTRKYRAAQMFFQAQEYTHAAELYRDLGKFDEAVGDREGSRRRNVIEGRRKCHQTCQTDLLLQPPDEDLLETMGRLSEAAELHYSEGRREEAIELFLRETENKNALRRAQECILEELWHRISFGVDSHVICSDLAVLRLMRFASRFDAALMGKAEAAEDQTSRLRELALEFHKMACPERPPQAEDLMLKTTNAREARHFCLALVFAYADYYNLRVRLHLQQILILQSLRENAHQEVEGKGTKFWLNRLYEALYPPHHVLGSISDLTLSTIPEAAKALNVVKDWVRTLVYGRAFLPHTNFLTDVMRATTFAFMFDRSQADYLRNAAYFSIRTPPMYFRLGGSPILPELLGVLCDLMDFLCSSVILGGRRPGMTVVHDVTVPRSWLLRSINHDLPYLNPRIQTNTFHLLLSRMRDLLEQLHDGGNGSGRSSAQIVFLLLTGASEYLLYGITRNLSNVPAVIRDVYMTRILKAIGLLGYNIRNDIFRRNVQRLLSSFRREGRPSPSLSSRYIDAASHSWDEFAKVIRRSLQYDTTDEMIQLLHKSKAPVNGYALLGVRQVVYDDLTNIQVLLDPNASIATSQTSELHIETSTHMGDDQTEEVEHLPQAEAVRDEGEDTVDAVDDNHMTRPEPSEQEITAAIHIQRAYRRILSRRRGIAKSGIAGLHAQIYSSCTKEVSRLGDNPGLYLRLFLVRADSLSHKKNTKERLKGCSPDEIDALDDFLTQTNKANKTSIKLQKELGPNSVLHERCDDKQLKKLVEEASNLVSTLPFSTSSELLDELHLAVTGIVTERSPPGAGKKPMKPTLNIEDDYGY
ncbi:hypothetical protein F5146DRAFT_995722 [Armillaria mellea]|nr:hypothetical protein F5146DRAFT_995722 [Armillaria mellea]